MCKYLEDISSVTQIGVGVVEDAFGEDSLLPDLIEFQVAVGSPWTILSRAGSFLQDLQTLWRRFRAQIIVERLCS